MEYLTETWFAGVLIALLPIAVVVSLLCATRRWKRLAILVAVFAAIYVVMFGIILFGVVIDPDDAGASSERWPLGAVLTLWGILALLICNVATVLGLPLLFQGGLRNEPD